MSKHTPTPWTCSNEGWGDGMADVRGPDHQLVCRIPILLDCPSGDGDLVENPEFEKNRAIVLASPDLLDACESHMIALRSKVRDGQDHPEYGEAIWQAERKMAYAIKKARGDQALHIVDWKWIELPPSLKEHHGFDVLERELSKIGVKVKP